MARVRGIVKWFSREKGYGFLRRENGDEIFVHHTDIEGEGFRALNQGETVEFEITSSQRGPRAASVRRVEEAASGERAALSVRKDRRTDRRPERAKASAEAASSKPTLAEQIRERLGKRFPAFRR